jgi:PmbA protein
VSRFDSSPMLALAERAVELARSLGADDAWAHAARARSVDYTVRDGKLDKVEESTSRGLSVQLYVDGRYSGNHTTDLRDEELAKFVREAVELTRALAPDPHRLMPDPKLFEGRSSVDLDLFDPAVVALTREDRLELCHRMNARLAGKPGVLSAESGVSDDHSESASASSNGFSGTHERTGLWFGSEVTLDDGDKRPAASMWGGARHRADVPTPEEIADRAMARARIRLGAKKGPTKRTTMVVDPSVSARVLSRVLGPANAHSLQQGHSFYDKRLGQRMFSDKLTIVDEPLLPRGLGSRWFDGEGIAAKPMDVIRDGVAANIYADTYYARKLGVSPTTGSSSNQVVVLGARGLDALVAATTDGILVEGWLGGNADSTTGDFSLGARGRLIEGGKLGASIAEMNVTGNLVFLFENLVEIGNDPWPYSSLRAPTLVFEDVQFAGT